MSKKVLLARPNPFIVKEMRKFISNCGYHPQPLEALGDLNNYKKDELAGIVISTALSSSVKDSFNDTLRNVLDTHSNIPIVIATLVPSQNIKRLTDNFLKDIGAKYTVKSIEDIDINDILNLQNTMIIIEKSMLTDNKKNINSEKIIRGFFG